MKKPARWKQRLSDFEKALAKLEEALTGKSFKELEKDGVIQRFEFTVELAWKTMQDYLEDQGREIIGGPKKVIKQAFSDGIIKNGDAWIQMLEDRNLMSHLYDRKTSDKIFENIQKKHCRELRIFANLLKKES